MSQARRLRRLPLLLLLAGTLGAGAACSGSGSGSGDGVASVKTASDKKSAGDSGGDDNAKTAQDREEAFLDFARCMREHGIDMPDPDTSGGGGTVKFGVARAVGSAAVAGTKIDAGMDDFQKANDACKDILGDVGPQTMDPKQQQEMQDKALAFSKCMREHGVDMPDPQFSGEGAVMMRIGDGIDPGDPKFQDAQQACGETFGPGPGGGEKAVGGLKGPGGAISVSPGSGGAGFSVSGSASSSGDGK